MKGDKKVPQYQILSCGRSHIFGNFNEAVFLLMLCLSDTEKKVWLATALCTFAIVRWLEIFRQRPTYRFSIMGSEYFISFKIPCTYQLHLNWFVLIADRCKDRYQCLSCRTHWHHLTVANRSNALRPLGSHLPLLDGVGAW